MYNTIKTNLEVIEKDALKIQTLRVQRMSAFEQPKQESLLKKKNLQLDDLKISKKQTSSFTPCSSSLMKRP